MEMKSHLEMKSNNRNRICLLNLLLCILDTVCFYHSHQKLSSLLRFLQRQIDQLRYWFQEKKLYAELLYSQCEYENFFRLSSNSSAHHMLVVKSGSRMFTLLEPSSHKAIILVKDVSLDMLILFVGSKRCRNPTFIWMAITLHDRGVILVITNSKLRRFPLIGMDISSEKHHVHSLHDLSKDPEILKHTRWNHDGSLSVIPRIGTTLAASEGFPQLDSVFVQIA